MSDIDEIDREIFLIQSRKIQIDEALFYIMFYERLQTIVNVLGSMTIKHGHSKRLDTLKSKVFLMIESIEK